VRASGRVNPGARLRGARKCRGGSRAPVGKLLDVQVACGVRVRGGARRTYRASDPCSRRDDAVTPCRARSLGTTAGSAPNRSSRRPPYSPRVTDAGKLYLRRNRTEGRSTYRRRSPCNLGMQSVPSMRC
jgi:hypothetical protein